MARRLARAAPVGGRFPVMVKISTEPLFRRYQKVVAVEDLRGVPAGTEGKVLAVQGLTWIRYHVLFTNGVQLANVDGAAVVDKGEWEERDRERRRAERRAQEEALAEEMRARIARGEVTPGPAAH